MFGVDCDLHIVTDHAGATPSSRLSGSVTSAKTIGTVRLRRRKAATLKVPLAKMMSGASAINCAAFFVLNVRVILAPTNVDLVIAAANPV